MMNTNDKLFAALFGNQDTETIPDDVPLTDEDFQSPSINDYVLELVEAYNKLKDENLNLKDENLKLKEMNRSLLSNNDEYSKALLAACEQLDNLQESLDEAEEEIDCMNEALTDISKRYTDLYAKHNKLLDAIKKAIV